MGIDARLIEAGDLDAVAARVEAIFGNRGVGLTDTIGSSFSTGNHGSYGGEDGDARLARIAEDILSGGRTFDNVRSSVDRLAANGQETSVSFPRLREGAEGAHVRDLQGQLQRAGYQIDVSGTYDEATRNAVRAFQGQLGLETDGEVGLETWRAFNTNAASPLANRPRQSMSTAPSSQAGEHPDSVLPPLAPHDFAELSHRRRQASAQMEEALARQAAARTRLESNTEVQLGDIGRQFDASRFDGLSELSGAGLGRNPRDAGRMHRRLRDQEGEQRGRVDASRTEQLAGLQAMATEARRARDEAHNMIDAEGARRRAELARVAGGA